MSEKSNVQRMLNEQAAYQGKLAPDPKPNAGKAQQGPPNLKMDLPPHMSDPSLGGGYVNDNAASVRAKNEAQDRARFGPPPAPKKP